MKQFIITFCIIMSGICAQAQVLVVKADLGSCPKCQIPLSMLSLNENKIPTYIALPESLIDDAADVEEIYGFGKSGFVTLYKDDVLNKFPKTSIPFLYLLNAGGNIIWKKPLLDITTNDIIHGNKIYKDTYLFKVKETEYNKFIYNKIYVFDRALHRLKILSGTDTFIYRMTEKDQAKAMEKADLKQGELSAEAKVFFAVNKQFSPAFIAYYPIAPNETFLMGRYYLALAVDTNTIIAPKNSIYHYRNGVQLDVYPVSEEGLDPGYRLDPTNFIAVDQQTILLPYAIGEKLPLIKPARFVGVFRLENGAYKFKRQLNMELPSVYKSNFGYNLISFETSSYPFLMLPFGKEIYNLENEKIINAPFPEQVNYGSITPEDLVANGNDIVSHRNVSLDYDKSNQTIYIISMYKRKHYLQIIDAGTGASKSVIQIDNYIPGINATRYIAVNARERTLYVENESKMVYGYPLSILK